MCVCVCVWMCLGYVYDQMTDDQSKHTCTHTGKIKRVIEREGVIIMVLFEGLWNSLSIKTKKLKNHLHGDVTEQPRDAELQSENKLNISTRGGWCVCVCVCVCVVLTVFVPANEQMLILVCMCVCVCLGK